MDLTARKIELVEAAKAHYAADILVKGTYGNGLKNFTGCSVGCMAHTIHPRTSIDDLMRRGSLHKLVADHFGYPEWLALLQDTIFEGLPNGPEGENNRWHVQLAEAIAALPNDHDWQRCLHRVHVGILRVAHKTAGSVKEVVERVIDLHERAGRGEDVSDELWSAAESAAWSAAMSAAESAAMSAAMSAAESAAMSAAMSAAESAARSAARSAAYQDIRDAVLAALPDPERIPEAA